MAYENRKGEDEKETWNNTTYLGSQTWFFGENGHGVL